MMRSLILVLLVVAGCSTGPTIRSHVDPSTDVSRYRTFGFYDAAVTGQSGYATFLSTYIQNAVGEQMRLRGYLPSENPELLINFHLQTADKVRVDSTPAPAYYGWRRGYGWGSGMAYETEVSTYTQGTLNIDVVDRQQNRLLWEGVAVGRIRQKAVDNPEPVVNAVVAKIFEKYPGRAAAP